MTCSTLSASIANCRVERQLRSVCTTTLATLRCTNISPGSKPTIWYAGTRLAALSHPNIITIHDFGQAGGFFYLLMEFVDGVNLRQALRAGRFTPEQALAIVPPLCDALQFAHERGIV